MKTNSKLAMIRGFANSIMDKIMQVAREKKTHIQDLQDRLDYVARNATYKGNRKPIGSTTPYSEVIKKMARDEVNSIRNQFSGIVMPDGRDQYYKKMDNG